MSGQRSAGWPEGVVARYVTAGGAAVDVSVRSGVVGRSEPTETFVACAGCPATHVVEWGWDAYRAEFGDGKQPDFDEGGRYSTREARAWAQSHAESCRAVPKPGGAR